MAGANVKSGMAPARPGATYAKMDVVTQADLINLLRAEYTSSGLDDSAFTRYASEKLGVTLQKGMVVGRRKACKIESNRPRVKAVEPVQGAFVARIETLERQMAHVLSLLDKLKELTGA